MSALENPEAFPAAFCVGPNDDLYPPTPGMSLRDWFAGQALTGLASRGSTASDMLGEVNKAYLYADTMLVRRAESGN